MTPTPEQQALIAVNRARIAALVAGEWDILQRYVAQDMQYISSAGTVHPKVEVFANFRSGALRLERQQPSAEQVRIYGDTAIVSYRADTVTVNNGSRSEAVTQCSSVYVHRDERWQLVLQHNTLIA